jgi:hypothetical protein
MRQGDLGEQGKQTSAFNRPLFVYGPGSSLKEIKITNSDFESVKKCLIDY